MDGTLLKGTSASLQIASYLGCAEELTGMEARFAAGEIDTRGFAVVIHRLWEKLTRAAVAEVFGASPWLAGIPEVCADIRKRGERSVVITMSPDFFARHLLELGVDDVMASRFPSLPFREPLDPGGILAPADKVRIVTELCNRHALPESRCVGYGDSMSDAPLFRRLSTGKPADEQFLRFAHPNRWHYDVLRALDYFRDGGTPDARLGEAVDHVRSRRPADGRWPLDWSPPGRVWFEVNDGEGKPSRWITLRAMRVLRWWDTQS